MGSAGQRALQSLSYVPVLHPEMLALYPVLGLYAHNMATLPFGTILRPMLALVALTVVLWIFLSVLFRSVHRAGLAASILVFASLSGWNVLESVIRRTQPWAEEVPPILSIMAYSVCAALCLFAVVRYYRAGGEKTGFPKHTLLVLGIVAAVIGAMAFVAMRLVMPWVAAAIVAAYLCVVATCLALVYLYRGDCRRLSLSLNWFAGVLLLLSMANILWHAQEKTPLAVSPLDPAQTRGTRVATPEAPYPDIYLFMLDGYASSNLLRTEFGYNNQPFLDDMHALGFEESPMSLANYSESTISAEALLNFDYPHKAAGEQAAAANVSGVMELYHHNRTLALLRAKGYRLQAFAPGVDALKPYTPVIDDVFEPRFAVSQFEQVLMANSAVAPFADTAYYLRNGIAGYWPRSFHRRHIEYALLHAGNLPAVPGPRFVMAHLTLPDQPFLFSRDGGWAQRYGLPGATQWARPTVREYRDAYVEQIHYLNSRLLAASREILAHAERSAIVLIVSTRGPAFEPLATPEPELANRFRHVNFVMTRFPDNVPGAPMPETVSLVNVLRYTFNRAFGLSLPLLPNEAYACPESKPLAVQPLTAR